MITNANIETFLKEMTISKDIIEDRDIIQDIIITSLMEDIYLSIKRNTNIIEISYDTVDPQLAQKVISTLISVYIDKRIDIHYSNSEYQFFKEQVMEVKFALNNVENKLSELKNKLTVGSFVDYYTNIIKRIDALQQNRDQNQTAMIQSESKIEFLTKTLKDMPTSLQTGTVIGNESIQSQIYSLYAKRQELLSKYSEDNNQLKEIDRQIAEIKKLLTDETKIDVNQNPNYLKMQQDLIAEQTNLVSLRAGSDAMNKKMDDLKKEVNNYNTIELEISQLEREKNTLIDRYDKYSNNLEEAQIDQIVQNQKLSNVKILQPATYPVRPIATRKMRNFVMGIFIGFFGGLGLAMVSEYFDHSVKRQEDIEQFLNLRTLVSIPEQPQKKFISFKKVENQ